MSVINPLPLSTESFYRPGAAILLAVCVAHVGAWWLYHSMKQAEPLLVAPRTLDVALELQAPAAAKPVAPLPAAPVTPPRPVTPTKPITPPKPKPVAKPKNVTKPAPQPVPTLPDKDAQTSASRSEPAGAPPAPAASSSSSTATSSAENAASSRSEAPAVPTPASFNAAYLHNPLPEYPAFAKKQKWQGRVTMKVHVLPTGLPAEVELQTTSGHDILDESALDTVRRWRFVPATKGGKPVASWVVVPLEFSLTH